MRSLKKFMAAGLAAAMVFSMTACSSKPAETAAPVSYTHLKEVCLCPVSNPRALEDMDELQ